MLPINMWGHQTCVKLATRRINRSDTIRVIALHAIIQYLGLIFVLTIFWLVPQIVSLAIIIVNRSTITVGNVPNAIVHLLGYRLDLTMLGRQIAPLVIAGKNRRITLRSNVPNAI